MTDSTTPKSNLRGTGDGQTFIINPELESNPVGARETKKLFILGLNVLDLSNSKIWNFESVRFLCTGVVPVTSAKKSPTKGECITAIAAYIEAERAVVAANAVKAEEILEEGYKLDTAKIATILVTTSGESTVNAIAAEIIHMGYKDSTHKSVLTKVAKMIRDNGAADADEVVTGLFKVFASVLDRANRAQHAKVVENLNDLKDFDGDQLIEMAEELLLSDGWKQLSVGICIATGRRMAEIHGTKTRLEFVDSGTIRFTGQLKTKECHDIEIPYNIPTLVDAGKVVAAYALLVSKYPNRIFSNPDDVNKVLGHPLGRELPVGIRNVWKSSGIESYKVQRAAYANICKSVFRPESQSENTYLSQILGHGKMDVNTANSYNIFKRYRGRLAV